MTDAPEFVTFIHQPDSFEPGYTDRAEARFVPVYTAAAARAGFTFRVIPVHELIPACRHGQPRLWHRDEDLLATRQCFQVDDFAPTTQAAALLTAVRSAIEASSSVLLNQSASAPHNLLTDKLAMTMHAAQLGIPTPATIAIPYGRHGRAVIPVAVRELGNGPYIIKPRQMAMGTSVLKADTAEQLTAAVDLATWSGTGHIIQAYLPSDGDFRAYYADGQVIAAQLRVPAAGGYLANVSQGGSATAATLPDGLADMTCRIAAGLGATLLAVDWLLTGQGPVLGEWSPGVGGFADLPDPERARVGDAHFGWARKRYLQSG
jgi:ribosomal protein S6--L-glutamate ligase